MNITISFPILVAIATIVGLGCISFGIRKFEQRHQKIREENQNRYDNETKNKLGPEWYDVYQSIDSLRYTSSIIILFDKLKEMPPLSLDGYEIMIRKISTIVLFVPKQIEYKLSKFVT